MDSTHNLLPIPGVTVNHIIAFLGVFTTDHWKAPNSRAKFCIDNFLALNLQDRYKNQDQLSILIRLLFTVTIICSIFMIMNDDSLHFMWIVLNVSKDEKIKTYICMVLKNYTFIILQTNGY